MWLDSLFSQNNEEAILSSPKNGDDIFLWLLLPRMTKKREKDNLNSPNVTLEITFLCPPEH